MGMHVSVPAAHHSVAVAHPVLGSPLPTLVSAVDLIDHELLETLPAMESDSMLIDHENPMAAALTKQKASTPPVNVPSSPEQDVPSKPPRVALSAYDADEIQRKRAARLARNRRSAQDLRNRKRQYAERVEQENETLKSQSLQLQARVSSLTTENNLLRQENEFYRGILAGRASTSTAGSAQVPSTKAEPTKAEPTKANLPTKIGGTDRRSARGVGVLASLLAIIGLTVNQEPVPSNMDASGLVVSESLPLSSRRALGGTDQEEQNEQDQQLALPDKDLVMRRHKESSTAVASHVGLVLKDAATHLVSTTDDEKSSSLASLQLGTKRFILAAADNAIRWVSTPLGGNDSVLDLESDAVAVRAPDSVEQDDYILGGPMRKTTLPTKQQQHYRSVLENAPKDTAVALTWKESDTMEFLVSMLATMDMREKEQVINMLVREYGADVFGSLFERAMTVHSQMSGNGTKFSSESSTFSTVSSSAEEDRTEVHSLPCECMQTTLNYEQPPHAVVPVVTMGSAQSRDDASG